MSLFNEASSVFDALASANQKLAQTYPGDRPTRQPIHTVYGGAQLYKAETTQRLGELALASLEAYGGTPAELAGGVGIRADLAETVHARVAAKLKREAVEDFRIDFEDGFGARPDAEEDETARRAAAELKREAVEDFRIDFEDGFGARPDAE